MAAEAPIKTFSLNQRAELDQQLACPDRRTSGPEQ
jgi:hypothetical protein